MFRAHVSLQEMVMYLLAFLIAITVHEYAHARAALAAGDDTAQRMGRISLNPIDHMDTLGTIVFVVTMLNGFVLAWGKPVPIDPYRFKNPRSDVLKVSIWGPLSNLITAGVLAILFRSVIAPTAAMNFVLLTAICIKFNLILAFFNMIPIPPLDGSKVLMSLMPVDHARRYEMFMGRYGMIILLLVLFTGVAGMFIGPPIRMLFQVLTGIPV